MFNIDPYKVLKTGPEEALQGDPLTILEKELKNIRYVKVKGIQDFTGGAIGYIGYDNVQYFEPRTKRDDLQDPMGLPDARGDPDHHCLAGERDHPQDSSTPHHSWSGARFERWQGRV